MKPPITNLPIETADHGFYQGFNRTVAIGSKFLIGLLIAWAAIFPSQAGTVLSSLNGLLSEHFTAWYMYVAVFYPVVCIVLAALPWTGRVKLGAEGDTPEFGRFSWFSMMFGAGIGIGMLTFATAEPLYHFQTNPEVIKGSVESLSTENIKFAYNWSFLHWGTTAWACYAMLGMSLAFFSYSRGLPLTIRAGLVPLFGKSMSGILGHIVDIVAVIATVVGIAVTIGFGISQFASGIFNITGADWVMSAEGVPTNVAMIICLVIVMGASTVSALSGVGRGIKWLSNLNMGLSFFLLAFFLIFGATAFALKTFFVGIWNYLTALPMMSLTIWDNDGTDLGKALSTWQRDWTVFYWAWWVAFAPFVGLFLARISKGRTIREFVLGAMIVPSLMCFIWFTFVGGTAIDLELNGTANGAILGVDQSYQLFETINILLSADLAKAMSVLIVILLLTYLVTSADSAVLIINTIASGGDESQKGPVHIIFWGVAMTAVIGVLLLAGGLSAIRTAMIIGALPFSFVMALTGLSLIKALVKDGFRNRSAASGSRSEPELSINAEEGSACEISAD